MPLDVPADTYFAVGADTVLAVHSAVDFSATEVALLVLGSTELIVCCLLLMCLYHCSLMLC